MDVSQEKLAGAKRMIIVLNPCNVVYTMETSMVNAKKNVHANVERIQIANKEPNVAMDNANLQVNVSTLIHLLYTLCQKSYFCPKIEF